MSTKRVADLKQILIKEKLDGFLVSSVSNITYLTGYANFSKDEREAYLIIGEDFQYIITDGRYSEAVKKYMPHFTLFERGYKNSTEDLLKNLKVKISTLAIEEDNLTVAEYKLIKKHFKKLKHFEMNNLKTIKDPEEIKKIEKACKIGDLAFKYILKKIKIGITEKQISNLLENFIQGCDAKFSFPAIVAFSKNSSIPHHHTGETILKNLPGQFILLDFGVKIGDYCSDMTRTIFFGKPSLKQKDIYNTVLNAQKKAVVFINSKLKLKREVIAHEVDKVARDYIISKKYPSIPHSLGHGIGLEVHEYPHISPKSKEVLKEGMVFSIEPGIYIPRFGGVRIEDLYVYQKGIIRQITSSSKVLISI